VAVYKPKRKSAEVYEDWRYSLHTGGADNAERAFSLEGSD
jgi:hypothetical protein